MSGSRAFLDDITGSAAYQCVKREHQGLLPEAWSCYLENESGESMITTKTIKAERREDGSIYVEKETWSDTIPADMLDHWIEWYGNMHQQHGYDGYREMAEALRAVKGS